MQPDTLSKKLDETNPQPTFTPVAYPATLSAVLEAISEDLGFRFNESTVKSRWIPERFNPAIENLVIDDLRNESGKWLALGHKLLWEYMNVCVVSPDRSAWQDWRIQLIDRYGVKADPLEELRRNSKRIEGGQLARLSEMAIKKQQLAEILRQKEQAEQALSTYREDQALNQALDAAREELAIQQEALEEIEREQARTRAKARLLGK